MKCPTCGRNPVNQTLSTSGKVLYLCGNKDCPQGSYFIDSKPKQPALKTKAGRRAKASYSPVKPAS